MNILKALAFGLALICATPAQAAYTITYDQGGVVDDYITKFIAIRQAGGMVVIDGPCISACTLLTGLIERDNVCVTKRASLAFHAAYSVQRLTREREFSFDATQIMWHIYPPVVQDFLKAKGWDGTKDQDTLVFMTYGDLLTIYQECPRLSGFQ
jgi:hypothetical protein